MQISVLLLLLLQNKYEQMYVKIKFVNRKTKEIAKNIG